MQGGEERSLFALGEIHRVRDIDEEIGIQLSHNAPQAMLRDLHRPVTDWRVGIFEFQRYEIPNDAGRGAMHALKSEYKKSHRVAICELAQTNAMWKAGWAELRSILRSPWQESPKLGKHHGPGWLSSR